MENELLNVTKTDFINYKQIKNSDYLPAFQKAVEYAEQQLKELTESKETIDLSKFEKATDLFDQLKIIYNNKRRVNKFDEENLDAQTIDSLISRFETSLYMNEGLFKKFKEINESKLSTEEKAVYQLHMRKFLENGIQLEQSDKLKEIKEIKEKINNLISQFEKNVVKDTEAYYMTITNEEEMKEFPQSAKDVARECAKEKGVEKGYCFTLQFPSYRSFMLYCNNREKRKEMFIHYNSRCYNTENSNVEVVRQILELRKKKASLLGFNSYNEYVLSNRMAKNEKEVNEFLESLEQKLIPFAKKEYEELLALAKSLDGLTELEEWDLSYYSEKLKKKKFGIDTEELKKYFPFEKVLSVLFELALKLYNIKVTKVEGEHLYNEDVVVYKMERDGQPLSYFYYDLYPRKGKTNGGWVYPLKPKIINALPIVGIIANNQRPQKEHLLSLIEAQTIFHEFGHALHIALSRVKYKSITGINVVWDFVECPSQLNENFIFQPEILEKFSIPKDIINTVIKIKNHFIATSKLRQLQLSKVDVAIHSNNFNSSMEFGEFERKYWKSLFKGSDKVCLTMSFIHLFNATYDYSCGYYSYLWAEVLSFDAFDEFKKDAVGAAKRFEEEILSKGGSENPEVLFTRFKGRKFSIDPFLKNLGLA